jgi:hypothetical protein
MKSTILNYCGLCTECYTFQTVPINTGGQYKQVPKVASYCTHCEFTKQSSCSISYNAVRFVIHISPNIDQYLHVVILVLDQRLESLFNDLIHLDSSRNHLAQFDDTCSIE